MVLGLGDSLASLVRTKYAQAQAQGALSFAPTELAIVHFANIPFQIRYAPSLAKKPEPLKQQAQDHSSTSSNPPPPKPNPFANPSADLLITAIPAPSSSLSSPTTEKPTSPTAVPPTHNLILNKFPIIRNHFILATATPLPQTHLLTESDLAATYACLEDWNPSERVSFSSTTSLSRLASGPHQPRERLFAFFNSGPHSGASQAHRHVQFLPLEDLTPSPSSSPPTAHFDHLSLSQSVPTPRGACKPPRDDNEAWPALAEAIVHGPHDSGAPLSFFRSHRDLPFAHFGTRLPPDASPATLHNLYLNLYQACLSAVVEYAAEAPVPYSYTRSDDGDDKVVPISYNLAMTTTAMVMCPRRAEGADVQDPSGEEVGSVQANGTLLGGTLLCKDEVVWRALRDGGGEALERVLEGVGIPSVGPNTRGRTMVVGSL